MFIIILTVAQNALQNRRNLDILRRPQTAIQQRRATENGWRSTHGTWYDQDSCPVIGLISFSIYILYIC